MFVIPLKALGLDEISLIGLQSTNGQEVPAHLQEMRLYDKAAHKCGVHREAKVRDDRSVA